MRALCVALGLTLALGAGACSQGDGALAAGAGQDAGLTGIVTSQKEGPMEGVLVSANRAAVERHTSEPPGRLTGEDSTTYDAIPGPRAVP